MSSPVMQIPFDLPVRTAFARDDFMVAPSNDVAVKFIDVWPNWPMPALTIFGPQASGKSHLASVWQARTQATELDSITNFDASAFTKSPQHILIDNFDEKINSESETIFFHIYNLAREHGRNILFLSERSPMQINFTLPDLASRLRACPAVEIYAPDDVLLSGVLVKLFADRQVRVTPEIISYLATRMERSFAAATALVVAIDQKALAEKRAVTMPLVRDVLRL